MRYISEVAPGSPKSKADKTPSQLASLQGKRVVAVRPYSARIREQMFDILVRVGLKLDQEDVLSEESTDDQVLQFLGEHYPDVLLIPFHAQRSVEGGMMDGLSTLRKLERRFNRYLKTPILMPISNMGMAAANLMFKRDQQATDDRILLLREGDLADPGCTMRVREHLLRFGS